MTELKYPFYIYLHTNGSLIQKVKFVVDSDPSYFDSPFVVNHWLVSSDEDVAKVKEEQEKYKQKEGIE